MTQINSTNTFDHKDFQLVIKRIPHVEFFARRVTLPSVSCATAAVPHLAHSLQLHGDKIQYGLLSVDFTLDKDLNNWLEIHDWIVEYSKPDAYEQYSKTYPTDSQAHSAKYSDGSVISSTNKYNPNLEFKFTGLFPISLSSIEIDTTQQSITPLSATVDFAFTQFNIKRNTAL